MSGFTDSALEKKLTELNCSQQSIQTLSLWLIHHRKHHKSIVQIWYRELVKAKSNRKLTFMYLANDVIQNSRKKGPEFPKEFSTILDKAFIHVHECVSDDKTKNGLNRIIKVWEERNVYDSETISKFRLAMKKESPKEVTKKSDSRNEISVQKSSEKYTRTTDGEPLPKQRKAAPKEELENTVKSPAGGPPDAEELIKALQDLENCPSTDAAVREKIASLPPEVSDVSLLDKIKNREAADRLSKQVEEADALLVEYNSRLSAELEDRKHLSKMLKEFTKAQRDKLALQERKLEEYKEQLKQIYQVQNELKSHLQNLPDMSRLPSVTGGLAPLPSAGDLFNQQ